MLTFWTINSFRLQLTVLDSSVSLSLVLFIRLKVCSLWIFTSYTSISQYLYMTAVLGLRFLLSFYSTLLIRYYQYHKLCRVVLIIVVEHGQNSSEEIFFLQ